MMYPEGPDPAYAVWSYANYLVVSLAVTVWVARTLHKNGRVFLVDAFSGNAALADSVNHLLVVGFYLINIGYVALALKSPVKPHDAVSAIEFFTQKQGWVLLVLGVMHMFNVWLFSRMRRHGLSRLQPPPLPPSERLPRTA
jgi:hypothetical protein